MTAIMRMNFGHLFTTDLRRRIISRSRPLCSECTRGICVDTSSRNVLPLFRNSRASGNYSFSGVRFASTGILPEPIVTFKPQMVEVQAPVIEPVAPSEKGEIIDLSNFLVQSEATPEQLQAIARTLHDVTAADLDIVTWAPTGGVYHLLNFLHEYLPWYGAIAVMTILFRLILTPVAVKSQKIQAIQSRYLPILTDAQERFEEAKSSGNKYDFAVAANDLHRANLKSRGSTFTSMALPMIQAPFFISTFWVLRKMSNYPVESMKEGGVWWFTDLTVQDPYFILPLITAATIHLVVRKGVDFGQNIAVMSPTLRNILLYGMPGAVLMFSYSFPAAVLCYWTTTNFVSLAQTWIFHMPAARKFFNIPDKKEWKPEELRRKKPKDSSKGIIEDIKDKIKNARLASKIQDYRALQASEFDRAGRGPIQQTFKYDPTKQRS